MNPSRRLADTLTGVALVVALAAATLWLWPVSVSVAPLLPTVAQAPASVASSPRDPSLGARIVETNVFSVTRRPPRTRWVAPDAGFATGDATLPTATLSGAALLPGLAPDPTVPVDPWPTAPPDEPSTPGGERASGVPATDPVVRARDVRVPALFGTVASADGVRALLRLDPRIPGAQLYAVGAEAGGWRVTRVESDRVVVTDRRGRATTLRLPRAAAPAATLPP